MNREYVQRLLVRVPNWIGDAVMCEPAVASVRALFPRAEITVLAKPAVAQLYQGHPGVDRTVIYEDPGPHSGLAGKWALSRSLRRFRFQAALLFQNAFEAALLTVLAGVPDRYGYATDGRRYLLTRAVAVSASAKGRSQVHYYLDLLRPLGWSGQARPPRLTVGADDQTAAGVKLREQGVGPGTMLIGLNPGSVYGSAKRWVPERFAEVSDRLVETLAAVHGKKCRMLIVGGRGEENLGRAIAGAMKHPPVVLSGATTIRELMGLIARCSLFVTNDTGPMHVAAALGVPVVAVFGPTDVRTTAPFGEGHAIVRQPVECSPCLLRECPIDHRCMSGVTTDMVYDAAMTRLNGLRNEPGTMGAGVHPPFNLNGVTVFLDRDGTLNRDTGYVKGPEELDLFPGTVDAVARLKAAGARVVIVTNQSGIARGLITPAALEAVHAKLRSLMGQGGGEVDAIYFCPHHPDEGCSCRKPQAAMIARAAAQLQLDPRWYYVVGDQRRDMELGRRIGARTVLVLTGPASGDHLAALRGEQSPPDHAAAGLGEAVEWIFQDVKTRRQPIGEGQAAGGTLEVSSAFNAER